MNIFVTDESPKDSAEALDDVRLNKMITESAQLMAAALIINGCPAHEMPIAKATGKPYSLTHKNHPCAVWTRHTRDNCFWLFQHFQAMLDEYVFRHGKEHYSRTNEHLFGNGIGYLPIGPRTPFQNCSRYKELETIFAYRQTMDEKWREDTRKPKWTKRGKPAWSKYDDQAKPSNTNV
jgi:hypothetical protein